MGTASAQTLPLDGGPPGRSMEAREKYGSEVQFLGAQGTTLATR